VIAIVNHSATMGESRNMIAGLYDLEETIGEGHYAVVKLARHVFTGEKVAVKVIDKMKLDQSTRMQMLQEVRLMKLVQHPNVVRLYEVIDTQTKLYLVLELGDGGDMYDYIMKHEGGLGEDKARKYFRQIVTAIQYCHKLHVVHRDLKPENVVFFEKLGMVKLTDFGFSNKFNPGQRLLTSCGSLAYSAPEILLGDAYDAPAVDIWSLGVILYMLVCGAAPFQEANDSETLTMIMDCNYIVPSHISQQCQNLISSMLCRDPSKRATLEQISSNVWLSADPTVPLWDMLPLVTREHLSEEDHAHIIQKMVAGSIASREHIIDCLDRNDYNHVTATYFLLAERKLRAQRHDTARRAKDKVGDRKKVQQSKTSVESLLSPQDGESQVDISTLSISGISNLSGMSNISTIKRNFNRVRKISIVEEEEEEEDDSSPDQAMPARGLSRHSSTSSLADKSAGGGAVSPQLHLDLTLAFAAQRLEDVGEPSLPTPAPFPQSSQIGTGLSRQNSLRRSGESTSGSSPCSERKSTPGSPASPTAGHSSPARFKLSHTHSSGSGRKLVGARSSPQLGPLVMATHTTLPILNQIHEESEEGGNSPGEDRTVRQDRQVQLQSVGAPAGAAVLRRLEQRRRLHKSRTASCSSSDASDDDSENRKKRGGRAGYPAWRDNNDSSDSQDPPGGSGGGGPGGGQGGFRPGGAAPPPGEAGGEGGGSTGSSGGPGEGGSLSGRHYRLHRNSNRVRQSYSLNRISELHETDFSGDPGEDGVELEPDPGLNTGTSSRDETDSEVARKEEMDSERQERSRRQFTPQLSSESDGEPGNEILNRYLDSLGQGSSKLTRSRDDSLNSSDSEYASNEDDRRRSKVNLRQLEERLNMIQEECNRLSEESDDERSATIDDRSEKNDNFDSIDDADTLDSKNNNDDGMSDCEEETDNRNTFDSVFSKIDQFLDNSRSNNKSSGRSRSEGWTFSDCEDSPRYRDRIIEIYSCRTKDNQYLQDKPIRTERRPNSERGSNTRGRPRSAPARSGKPLHRAHSCGSLMSKTNNGQCGGFWDLLSDKSTPITILSTNEMNGTTNKSTELTLTLTSVSAPLSLLHLQTGTSRCCNLC